MNDVTERETAPATEKRLPLLQMLLVSFQHVLLMYGGAVAVPLIVGQAAGLSREEIAFLINERQENIGARRLHTVLEKLLEKLSFEAPDKGGLSLMVDKAMVDEQLGDAVQDPDLSRYIL